jgi:hypothetical protein
MAAASLTSGYARSHLATGSPATSAADQAVLVGAGLLIYPNMVLLSRSRR